VKRKNSNSGMKLHLAKETIRHLLSEELRQVEGGGRCPSATGCSNGGESFNECGSIYCSMIQY